MSDRPPVSLADLEAESVVVLPAKEVISLLNLDIDLDVALDLAAPIDLAIAANANVAAPIDAAVSANVLAIDSLATGVARQATSIEQFISGEAIADAPQNAIVDQSNDVPEDGGAPAAAVATDPTSVVDPGTVTDASGDLESVIGDATGSLDGLVGGAAGLLSDGLLNVNVDAAVDADIAAPIAGAVAANANVAAPIAASVAANIGTINSEAVALAEQTAVITQNLEDVTAHATAAQTAEVIQ